jgi:hypothetical protein
VRNPDPASRIAPGGRRMMPNVNAVDEAAYNAKSVANDQRGFLLSADQDFIRWADRHAGAARRRKRGVRGGLPSGVQPRAAPDGQDLDRLRGSI